MIFSSFSDHPNKEVSRVWYDQVPQGPHERRVRRQQQQQHPCYIYCKGGACSFQPFICN